MKLNLIAVTAIFHVGLASAQAQNLEVTLHKISTTHELSSGRTFQLVWNVSTAVLLSKLSLVEDCRLEIREQVIQAITRDIDAKQTIGPVQAQVRLNCPVGSVDVEARPLSLCDLSADLQHPHCEQL